MLSVWCVVSCVLSNIIFFVLCIKSVVTILYHVSVVLCEVSVILFQVSVVSCINNNSISGVGGPMLGVWYNMSGKYLCRVYYLQYLVSGDLVQVFVVQLGPSFSGKSKVWTKVES